MQGIGMLYLLFHKVIVVLLNRNIQPLVRNKSAFIERVFAGMTQGNKLIVLFKILESKGCGPANCFKGSVPSPSEPLCQRSQFSSGGNFVESPDAYIDRMDFSPAQQTHDLVSHFFQLKAALDNFRMVFRHLNRVIIAQKIGCVEHVHMKGMAFNPFTAIDQPAKCPELPTDLDPNGTFHGM